MAIPDGNVLATCPRCDHEFYAGCWETSECPKCGLKYEGQHDYYEESGDLDCWVLFEKFNDET
jgi:uncharacterized C2H2 Zn-finger protein